MFHYFYENLLCVCLFSPKFSEFVDKLSIIFPKNVTTANLLRPLKCPKKMGQLQNWYFLWKVPKNGTISDLLRPLKGPKKWDNSRAVTPFERSQKMGQFQTCYAFWKVPKNGTIPDLWRPLEGPKKWYNSRPVTPFKRSQKMGQFRSCYALWKVPKKIGQLPIRCVVFKDRKLKHLATERIANILAPGCPTNLYNKKKNRENRRPKNSHAEPS